MSWPCGIPVLNFVSTHTRYGKRRCLMYGSYMRQVCTLLVPCGFLASSVVCFYYSGGFEAVIGFHFNRFHLVTNGIEPAWQEPGIAWGELNEYGIKSCTQHIKPFSCKRKRAQEEQRHIYIIRRIKYTASTTIATIHGQQRRVLKASTVMFGVNNVEPVIPPDQHQCVW